MLATPVPGETSTRICVSRVFRSTIVMCTAPPSRCKLLCHRSRVQRAGVQRHPDYRGSDAPVGELAKIVDARDATGSNDRMHGLFGDVLHEKEIRASELSLAMHGGDQNAAQGDVVELLDDVEDRARERAGPSSRDDLALAHI